MSDKIIEAIARQLAELDGVTYDMLPDRAYTIVDGKTKADYHKRAKPLLSTLKEMGFMEVEEKDNIIVNDRINNLILSDERIRAIVDKWFPISQESLNYAYKGDIKEVARDFGYHIVGAQLDVIKKNISPYHSG